MIVNLLPDLLESKDVSIRELSRITGVTYTTIRAAYHGERSSINLDVLDAICEALNLQPGDIYRRVSPGETLPAVAKQIPGHEERQFTRTEKPKHLKAPPGGGDGWITWE